MTATAMTIPGPEELVNKWLQGLEADDRAKGTIRRYKSVVLSFLSWYEQQENRLLGLENLSPIALVGLSQLSSKNPGTSNEYGERASECSSSLVHLAHQKALLGGEPGERN